MDLKLIWAAPLSSVVLPVSLMSFQPLWNNDLRLATYQSYISDEVASNAHEKYGITTTYFENDKEVLSGFRTGMYDLAIVSSSTLEEAVSQNLVKKIDWSKLSAIPEKYKSKDSNNNKPFTDELFAPIINHLFDKNPQMYEYSIPYFLSYLSFVYTGEKLKAEEELSWKNLLEQIASDSRFLPSNRTSPSLAFIEDELTIYYISKLVSGEKGNQKDFFEQLSELITKNRLGKLGPKSIFLHPNSALVSEMMISAQLKGAFMYNGDALYTYQSMKEQSKSNGKNMEFNVFEGKPSLWLLDSIAISSKISGEREDKVYEFLSEFLFKGIVENDSNSQDLKIDESSLAWKNFDYLKYTPTLKGLQKKLRESVKKDNSKDPKTSTQFDQKEKEILFGVQKLDECEWENNKNSVDLQKEKCQVLFESSMSDSQNLRLALAFQRWKSNL